MDRLLIDLHFKKRKASSIAIFTLLCIFLCCNRLQRWNNVRNSQLNSSHLFATSSLNHQQCWEHHHHHHHHWAQAGLRQAGPRWMVGREKFSWVNFSLCTSRLQRSARISGCFFNFENIRIIDIFKLNFKTFQIFKFFMFLKFWFLFENCGYFFLKIRFF